MRDFLGTNQSHRKNVETVVCIIQSCEAVSPPPPSQAPTIFCSSAALPTTYLCQTPTIIAVSPTPTTTISPPNTGYVYATSASNIVYTEVDPASTLNCVTYSPTPPSPRDVNEISLHISLLDSRTQQIITF